MIGFGQGWVKAYNAGAYDVDCTNDGGYIIGGAILANNNNSDVWLLKLDHFGNEQWVNIFGSVERDECFALEQTNDGGYILTGYYGETSSSYGEIWLSKMDNLGNQIWSNTYGVGRASYSVQQTSDNGYIIATSPNNDVLKIDGFGNLQWTRNYVSDIDQIFSIKQTNDAGYIMTGQVFGNQIQVCTIKVDSLGNTILIKKYGNNSFFNESRDIEQTTDGGYIIAATKGLSDTTNVAWLIKTDNQGDTIWTNIIQDILSTGAFSVAQTTDGGYITSGMTSSTISSNIFLAKTDANGMTEWTQTYGGTSQDAGFSVKQTNDGGFIIASLSFSNTHTIIKTDGSGNITSTLNIPINPNRKLEKVVDILGKQTKPQTNIPFIEIYDDGTVVKRIVLE